MAYALVLASENQRITVETSFSENRQLVSGFRSAPVQASYIEMTKPYFVHYHDTPA